MKYKFKVTKRLEKIDVLNVTCSADNYQQALEIFNSKIKQVEQATKYKELESTTTYSVKEQVDLIPLSSNNKLELTTSELCVIKDLVIKYLPEWDYYIGWCPLERWDTFTLNDKTYKLLFLFDGQQNRQCSVYQSDENESNTFILVATYQVLTNE